MRWVSSSPSLGGIFDLEKRQEELRRLEERVAQPGFWDNQAIRPIWEEAQTVLKQLSQTKEFVQPWLDLSKKLEDLQIMVELAQEEAETPPDLTRPYLGGPGIIEEIEAELSDAKKALESLELSTFLSGEHDRSSAILEINAGAGGT